VYDRAGRLAALVSPLGNRSSFAYDGNGRLTGLIDPLGRRTSSVYNPAGRMAAAIDPLGNRSSSTFDPAGRVTVLIDALGRRTSSVFDTAGRVIARIDPLGSRTSTVYDAAGETRATVNALGYRTSSAYDAAGRRVRLTDANGNATTFLYDAAGQDVGRIDPLLRRTTFAYDLTGRRTLTYNGAGRRVQKQTGGSLTRYVWDGERVLQDADGGTGATQEQYLAADRGYGDLVSGYGNAVTRGYEFDAIGSAEALLDDTGTVTNRWVYRAYGSGTQTQGTDANAYTWVGRDGYRLDSETGLYLIGGGVRYYEPGTGRFLTRDPSEYAGGDPNLYRYGFNDPVNQSDPGGLGTEKECLEAVDKVMRLDWYPQLLANLRNSKCMYVRPDIICTDDKKLCEKGEGDYGAGQVRICYNNLSDKEMYTTIIHELVHLYDDCFFQPVGISAKVLRTCRELRAYLFSGQCFLTRAEGGVLDKDEDKNDDDVINLCLLNQAKASLPEDYFDAYQPETVICNIWAYCVSPKFNVPFLCDEFASNVRKYTFNKPKLCMNKDFDIDKGPPGLENSVGILAGNLIGWWINTQAPINK
jgi:RHS repeat-associated protein